MIIKISAGHNPDGKVACGAIGLKKESTQARKVTKKVIKYLKESGHTVYDCTVNNGTSPKDVLNKIIYKHNSSYSDLDVSIHFNVGVKDTKGNGKTTGVEVFVLNVLKEPTRVADNVCKEIASLGFRNRGVKPNSNLAFLNSTNAPSMLIEVCFLDDADDVKIYNADKVAKAIVKGILNSTTNYSCVAKCQMRHFNDAMQKVGTVKKGFEFIIDKVDYKDGFLVGRRKHTQTWVKLKYTKLKVEK